MLAGWWILSSIFPGFPSPAPVVHKALHAVKLLSDEVYLWAGEEKLRDAADRVHDEAEEEIHLDTVRSDTERLSVERRKRLPILRITEDSALRTELRHLSSLPPVGGKLLNILVIGIDSRLSVRDARADALHLFTVNPDSGIVEIMSIPRDTYTDLGYPDTTHFNIIANAKTPNNQLLMRKVSELTKRGQIKYYIEVGFSQAMGILEILGYSDPVSTLQFLRTRRTLAGGDLQRAHNQAVFLRQNLIDKFSLFTGATGDVIISAGLKFVTTNLTRDFCLGLVYSLTQKNFPHHRQDAVRLRMLPIYNIRLRDMIADSLTIYATLDRVQRSLGETETHKRDVTLFLRNVNRRAMADSARPGRVAHRLRRLVEQRAWLQIQDKDTRVGVRDTMTTLLDQALRKLGHMDEADRVVASREAEDLLMRNHIESEER